MISRTPSEATIIRNAIQLALRNTWTMLPGKVVEYNAETQKCSVQPLIKETLPGMPDSVSEADRAETLPIISDVPVVWLRTKYAYIYLPMKPGAKVMLLFGTRSLDKWVSGDGEEPIDPQDVRNHDLSDAVAVPGLFPFGDPIPAEDVDDDDIRIVNDHPVGGKTIVYLGGDTGDVVIIPARFIQLGEAEAAEFSVLGETAIEELEIMLQSFLDNAPAFVQTGTGPGVLDPNIQAAIQTFIDNLLTWLTTIAKVS